MKLAYNYFVFIEQVGLAVVNGQLMAIGGFTHKFSGDRH
jgi:hypothetical protein